jgi:hypothetical protein
VASKQGLRPVSVESFMTLFSRVSCM